MSAEPPHNSHWSAGPPTHGHPPSHPWASNHYYNHWRWQPRRGPTRLIWFGLGAGAATLWIRNKNHCHEEGTRSYNPWVDARYRYERAVAPPVAPSAAVDAPSPAPAPAPARHWDDEIDRARQFRQQATTTVSRLALMLFRVISDRNIGAGC